MSPLTISPHKGDVCELTIGERVKRSNGDGYRRHSSSVTHKITPELNGQRIALVIVRECVVIVVVDDDQSALLARRS